jgi:hypothetical protein
MRRIPPSPGRLLGFRVPTTQYEERLRSRHQPPHPQRRRRASTQQEACGYDMQEGGGSGTTTSATQSCPGVLNSIRRRKEARGTHPESKANDRSLTPSLVDACCTYIGSIPMRSCFAFDGVPAPALVTRWRPPRAARGMITPQSATDPGFSCDMSAH